MAAPARSSEEVGKARMAVAYWITGHARLICAKSAPGAQSRAAERHRSAEKLSASRAMPANRKLSEMTDGRSVKMPGYASNGATFHFSGWKNSQFR